MKNLIFGLGNIGEEYKDTRHNVGFMVIDAICKNLSKTYSVIKYGIAIENSNENIKSLMIKPTVYMNRSGLCVDYWLKFYKMDPVQMLVIVDDLQLELGQLRLRKTGSSGGHNGLKDLERVLKTKNYPRLRIGIGNNFAYGNQVDFVLGKFSISELDLIKPTINNAVEVVKSFCLYGYDFAAQKLNCMI